VKTWKFHLTAPDGASSTLTSTFEEGNVEVAASLVTTLPALNDDLVFTAKTLGTVGNSISVEFEEPGGPNAPLTVTTIGNRIIVSLASNDAGELTSTASQVQAAISASPSSSDLVNVQLASGNNGTGTVSAMAETFLSGGGLTPANKTYVVPGAKVGGGRSPFEFFVTTQADAILLSASATGAAANSNVTVAGCS
jgi:hypothetical protein